MSTSAAASVELPPKQDTVSQHAKACLREAGGDVASAAILLERRVMGDKKLKAARLDPRVADACHQAIALEIRKDRERVWTPPNVDRPGMTQQDRVRILAASNLLTFPLPGGKRLGDATRPEIEDAAEFYRKQSNDMAHKATWLRLVAQSIPDGKRAGAVLTDARLRELQQEAAKS